MVAPRCFPFALALAAFGSSASCTGSSIPEPVKSASSPPPRVRVVKAEDVPHDGFTSRPVSVAFGAGQDGTKLVTDFLTAAERQGAVYVSDMRIYVLSGDTPQRLECRTDLFPTATQQTEMVPVPVPGERQTYVTVRPVTQTVMESQYECHMVTRPVNRMETTYESQYDSFSKSTRMVPQTRMVTTYQPDQECRTVMVPRTVTRYENELAVRYTPPRFDVIAKESTAWDLHPGPPRCVYADEAAQSSRIEATLYFRAVLTPEPPPAP